MFYRLYILNITKCLRCGRGGGGAFILTIVMDQFILLTYFDKSCLSYAKAYDLMGLMQFSKVKKNDHCETS